MKGEFELIAKEQILLRTDVKMTTICIAVDIIVEKNKIVHLEIPLAILCSKPEITERFSNDLSMLRLIINKSVEAHNEIGSNVNLRFKRVADWLERVKLHMIIMPRNAQVPNRIIRS